MEQRRLGNRNVAAIGFGTMSFGGMFGATDEATSLACLDAAVDAGIGHFDTANIYGMGVSEQIIGRWGRPDLHLATKCGIVNGPPRAVRNDEPYIRQCLEESLRRLKREHVDLYYIHRRQPDIPVEDVAGTMSKLVQEGKIGGYGLSEIAPSTLRRAHAEYPVTAVQSEFSLWTRLPQLGLIQACRELGVAFVAFSPLGRGMFGREPLRRDFRAGIDFRETNPRFTEPNFSANLAAIAPFRASAPSGAGRSRARRWHGFWRRGITSFRSRPPGRRITFATGRSRILTPRILRKSSASCLRGSPMATAMAIIRWLSWSAIAEFGAGLLCAARRPGMCFGLRVKLPQFLCAAISRAIARNAVSPAEGFLRPG